MGKRSTGRKLAMQLLYQSDIRGGQDPGVFATSFWELHGFQDPIQEWAMGLASATWQVREQVDGLIAQFAIGWSIQRIQPVDKAVLRLAFYELLHTDTDPKIIINEAVELSKRYSTTDSPRFINGILGGYLTTCSPASSAE
ncbi:transcription antitermination factor NusB [bacterium]|nr:transcription antitermination factor NusB [bacterium]